MAGTVMNKFKMEDQCKHLEADMVAYDEWYLYCEHGETANEDKCQKGLRKCDFFERRYT
jgi:hypothetical protein